MQIIKEKDMCHEIFSGKEITDKTLEIYRFSEPDGYIYINKGKEGFSININSLSIYLKWYLLYISRHIQSIRR